MFPAAEILKHILYMLAVGGTLILIILLVIELDRGRRLAKANEAVAKQQEEMYYQTLSAPKPMRMESPLEAFSERRGQRGREVGEPNRPPRPAPVWRF